MVVYVGKHVKIRQGGGIYIGPEVIGSVITSQLSEITWTHQNIVSSNKKHTIDKQSGQENLYLLKLNNRNFFLQNRCLSHFQKYVLPAHFYNILHAYKKISLQLL